MSMTSLVFDIELDPQIVKSIQELRRLRREVLTQQLEEIDETLVWLMKKGTINSSEKEVYRQKVREQLEEKIGLIDSRLGDHERVYGDELELFYDLKR